jgi:Domain of unknown function (DUF4926)
MNFDFYLKTVIYTGPSDKIDGLENGDLGVVVECFPNDDYYVEFSEPDGCTRVLAVLNRRLLKLGNKGDASL